MNFHAAMSGLLYNENELGALRNRSKPASRRNVMPDASRRVEAARILVVEDELIIAKGVQKRLQNMGYIVIDIVPSGEEAVQTAVAEHPDLILMDINLSGDMDGIGAAEQIRSVLTSRLSF